MQRAAAVKIVEQIRGIARIGRLSVQLFLIDGDCLNGASSTQEQVKLVAAQRESLRINVFSEPAGSGPARLNGGNGCGV